MERLIANAVSRLENAGLVAPASSVFGAVDDVVYWNRADRDIAVLSPVFDRLDIAALLYARPAEPYGAILDYLVSRADVAIRPEDTESRTFLHEIAVRGRFDTDTLVEALGARKSVVLPGGHLAVLGTISIEQAYLHFSSVCFAVLVKFLSGLLSDDRRGAVCNEQWDLIGDVLKSMPTPAMSGETLRCGPFEDGDAAQAAMTEAGRAVVGERLVDSFFGNLSYRVKETLYISQTGSALDALEGNIDPVRMDGGSTAAITASSELLAHLRIVEAEPVRAILHGHPPFAVALSLDCGERERCKGRDACHLRCDAQRTVEGTPIVPGEVGTGPTGIATTLPPAIRGRDGVIVHGHGVFTVGKRDFRDAFNTLVDIETRCRKHFAKRVTG